MNINVTFSVHKCYVFASVLTFFFPSVGGIETHIMELAKELIARGHNVVVVTRSVRGFIGEKMFLNKKLKVYYLAKCSCGIGSSLLTFWFSVPEIVRILTNENITHVHGHQTTSGISFEVGSVAKMLDIPVFVTEHSLFSIADFGALNLSKALTPFIHACDQVIAVSEVQRANMNARFGNLSNISVIPNGIDPSVFTLKEQPPYDYPVIITVTRFEKRRGVEMLPAVVKNVCELHRNARWIIAGSGSMLPEMLDFWKSSEYKDRIEILGQVSHDMIPEILHKGHIFLNCSLIDSFCISAIEAIACGLYVISTDVGGISEVLNPDSCTLCDPCVSKLTLAISEAIHAHKPCITTRQKFRDEVIDRFSWTPVTSQVLSIYQNARSKRSIFHESVHEKGFFSAFLGLIYFSALYIVVSLFR